MTQTLIDMSRLLAMDAVIILAGMMWDLAVGIRKAVERGEARTSYGLTRTATKMLTYYGAFPEEKDEVQETTQIEQDND